MIFGHGIDLQEISAVKKAYDRNPRFAKKVLTPKEWERFESLSGNRQMSYLAGRWAGKEAFSKAWGTGIGAVGFKDIEILTNDKGVISAKLVAPARPTILATSGKIAGISAI